MGKNKQVSCKEKNMNMKCEDCDFVTNQNGAYKRHVQAKHTLKKCNECEYTTLSMYKLKNHKDSQHEPDDFEETSAFYKFIYVKT